MTPASDGLFACDVNVDRYLALVDAGDIEAGERTELLSGVIVAMAPQSPLHAAAVYRIERALRETFPPETVIRVQMPLVAGRTSMPEPDVAVMLGREADYVRRYPSTALLVVEVSLTTLSQDRLTKAAIYSSAGVPNYLIVQPEREWVELRRGPSSDGSYDRVDRHSAGDLLELDGTTVRIACERLFPGRLR